MWYWFAGNINSNWPTGTTLRLTGWLACGWWWPLNQVEAGSWSWLFEILFKLKIIFSINIQIHIISIWPERRRSVAANLKSISSARLGPYSFLLCIPVLFMLLEIPRIILYSVCILHIKALVAVILTPTYRGLRSKDDGYNVLHTYPCPTAHCPFYQPLNQLTVHSLTEEGSLLLLLLSNHHFSVPTVNRQHQQGVVFLVLRLS